MKLLGNLKGVSIYPKMIKEVTPTKHKYGADVTWSAHTDTYKPTLDGHGIDFEINAFKFNLAGTILLNHQTDDINKNKITDALNTGRLDSGVYFRAVEELQTQIDWYRELTGRDASYWSYANGIRDHDDFVLANSIVSRLSRAGEVDYDFNLRLGKSVSSLFNYNVRDINMETALSNAETSLQNAVDTSGWYNDFSHWHWAEFYGEKNQWNKYLESQKNILENINYVSLGAGEAVEYMFLRKSFKRGGIYQDGEDLFLVCDVRDDFDLPYTAVDTSLSIEVDLSGTVLENKEVRATSDVFRIATNKFIVQVPYSKQDGFRVVKLSKTLTPDYLDLSLPTFQSSSLVGNRLTVKASKPVNIVVFSTPANGELYQAEIIMRSNTMSELHEMELSNHSGKDIYVGMISGSKQSILHRLGF